MNPQQSGIADYSEELLDYLRKDAEIDLFVDDVNPSNPKILENFRCYNYQEFSQIKNNNKYDNIIYHMGNNVLHEYIYLTLMRYPGIAILHDYNIHPFVREITLARRNSEAYYKAIENCYRDIGKILSARLNKEKRYLNTYRFPLNNTVCNLSKAVIVHSKWVKNQIANKNVVVIPMGVSIEPEITQEAIIKLRKKKGLKKDQYIISCLGDVVHTKRIDVVIKAFSILKLFIPNAKLILIGKCYQEMKEIIETLIERYRLNEFISITGRVTLEEYKEYMKLSDVIINLRFPTLGETSASLMRTMSYSKPAILSSVNQFNEIPDECCIKVNVGRKEQDLLLNALMKLRKDPYIRTRIGKNARRYVIKNCSWDIVAEKYLSVLHSYTVNNRL